MFRGLAKSVAVAALMVALSGPLVSLPANAVLPPAVQNQVNAILGSSANAEAKKAQLKALAQSLAGNAANAAAAIQLAVDLALAVGDPALVGAVYEGVSGVWPDQAGDIFAAIVAAVPAALRAAIVAALQAAGGQSSGGSGSQGTGTGGGGTTSENPNTASG